MWSRSEQKNAEICPPLSIRTKSDFVFTRPGSKPESALLAVMSAPPSCGHNAANAYAAWCRYCCKSLFAQVTKNFPGRRRDVRVKMWGTSSPDHKLAGDLGNVIEATSIGDRRSDFFTAEKLAPSNLGLLQQYRHKLWMQECPP